MLNKNRVEPKEILKKLRGNGFRITPARKSIIDILSVKHDAVSLTELKKHLETRNVRADRTTIYREILFLKQQGTICEIPIGGGKKGYKICEDGHHHHLICIRCNRVEEIVLKNTLALQEKKIARQRGFQVLDHLLEFYGFCGDCQ
ncbi:MAG: transcriptional repressor [Deltaproteobacteria bacterium]|nr:transcriptional repressor [Deltaproteobacteria bacterium]MBM4322365.1 transcriptional repressor [Deltaproteobacteria bacterium]